VYVPTDAWAEVQSWGWRDCKRLTPEKRLELVQRLHAEAKDLGVHYTVYDVEPTTIDTIGPRSAWLRATRSAVMLTAFRAGIELSDISVIVDGKEEITILPAHIPQAAIPNADRTHLPVMIASVLARTHRDVTMAHLDRMWPAYNFKVNHGEATLEHMTVLLKVGPVYAVHRKHYLRKSLLAHWDRYMHYVMALPLWLVKDAWLRNVSDGDVAIETTWPVINPDDPVYLEQETHL
jgi:ribonuclease HII